MPGFENTPPLVDVEAFEIFDGRISRSLNTLSDLREEPTMTTETTVSSITFSPVRQSDGDPLAPKEVPAVIKFPKRFEGGLSLAMSKESTVTDDSTSYGTVPAVQHKVDEFLNSMSADGGGKVGSVETQSAEVSKRISILEGTPDARPILPLWRENKHVHEMFEFWVRAQPEAPALEIWETAEYCKTTLSYKDLNAMADNVALLLLRLTRGKTANRVALIHIPRSAELVVAILAVAKAGMAFAAVDTEELPLERLHYILGDTKSRILLTTHHEKESPKIGGVHHLFVEDIMNSISSWQTHFTSIDRSLVDDEDLLALIYTSGSTGKPKGVMIQHGAFANYHAVEQVRVSHMFSLR